MKISLDGDIEEVDMQTHQTPKKTNKEFHDAQAKSEQIPQLKK